jgi:hypothetical protein
MSNPYDGSVMLVVCLGLLLALGVGFLIFGVRLANFSIGHKRWLPASLGILFALFSIPWIISPLSVLVLSHHSFILALKLSLSLNGMLLIIFASCCEFVWFSQDFKLRYRHTIKMCCIGVMLTISTFFFGVEYVDVCPSNHEISVLSQSCDVNDFSYIHD